jgi:hypothetical protein
MDWLLSLLSGGASLLSGGLLGAIGGIATGFLKMKEKKNDQAHELAMRDKDMEMIRLEADSAVRLEEARAVTMKEKGEAEAFLASQANAKIEVPASIADKASPWVCTLFVVGEFLKGQVRVWLTAVSFGAIIYFAMRGSKECVTSLIFLGELSGGWWFAQRQMTKS